MVLIVMGVAGSGKTTVGRRVAACLHWEFQDADCFHPMANIEKMAGGVPLTDQDRRPWLAALRRAIEDWLIEGRHVVLACSALTAQARHTLTPDPKRVRLVYLKATYQIIYDRLARRRHHFMPTELLDSQFALLEEPTDAIVVDASQPLDALVPDICRRLAAEGLAPGS
ncbi:gluconokinase [Candidatus Nitrospira bockiana]